MLVVLNSRDLGLSEKTITTVSDALFDYWFSSIVIGQSTMMSLNDYEEAIISMYLSGDTFATIDTLAKSTVSAILKRNIPPMYYQWVGRRNGTICVELIGQTRGVMAIVDQDCGGTLQWVH